MGKENIENQANINAERIRKYETQLNNAANFINNLTESKDKFIGSKINRLNYDSEDLNISKENLNPPIDIGLVFNTFGTNFNGATNTLSINNGVDFSVAKGSKVYAVAEGTVTIVGELPYYGKCVILKHGNGFRTLYASLSEVNVEPGSVVKLNQIIGKSGETLEGQTLHFEIWKDITPLNALEWLRK
jgi:murein DD-endopeptidase MepM/ murein hydrolase activator NlpD